MSNFYCSVICSRARDADPLLDTETHHHPALSLSPSQPLRLDYSQKRRVDQAQGRVRPAHDGEEIRNVFVPRPDLPRQPHAHGTYIPEEFYLRYRLGVVQRQLTFLQYLINNGTAMDPRTDQLHMMMIRLVWAVRGKVLAPHRIGVRVLLGNRVVAR